VSEGVLQQPSPTYSLLIHLLTHSHSLLAQLTEEWNNQWGGLKRILRGFRLILRNHSSFAFSSVAHSLPHSLTHSLTLSPLTLTHSLTTHHSPLTTHSPHTHHIIIILRCSLTSECVPSTYSHPTTHSLLISHC
jgi:hypothetical protein